MKRTNRVYTLTAVVLGLALAFAAASLTAPHSAVAAAALPDEHHEIHDALDSLRHAREHIEKSKHDFNGHRQEALQATDNAIRELEVCLKYDE
jgi:Spy/CpxP family protein refolding chaperone